MNEQKQTDKKDFHEVAKDGQITPMDGEGPDYEMEDDPDDAACFEMPESEKKKANEKPNKR